MGKGRGPNDGAVDPARQHHSAPLSTLKDPATFGQPPKHVHYHGGQGVTAYTPDRTGLGAPVPTAQNQGQETGVLEEEEKPKGPSLPYRSNTTGIRPETLPKPPIRRVEPEVDRTPPSNPEPTPPRQTFPRPPITQRAKPTPPPRLPPRQNSHPDVNAVEPPPTYTAATRDSMLEPPGYLNKSAIERLGQAGVSVPGFNIGGTNSSATFGITTRTTTPQTTGTITPPISQPAAPTSPSQLKELQSRFARLKFPSSTSPNTTSSSTTSNTTLPGTPQALNTNQGQSQGTTWAQKQSALATASQFHKDPSSISLSDARGAAFTANNFKQRHGEQVASGLKTANGLSQKYGVVEKVGGAFGQSSNGLPRGAGAGDGGGGEQNVASGAGSTGVGLHKASPPPPPPKKKAFASIEMEDNSAGEVNVPPPVPLASKPR